MANKQRAKQNMDSNGTPMLALMPVAGGTEEVTTGNESAAFTTNVCRLLATSGSPRVRFGDTGISATADDMQLVSGIPEYFSVDVGSVVAVFGGTVEVTNFRAE